MSSKFAAPLAGLIFAAAAGLAQAQTNAATAPNPDLQFAHKAASGGHAEVALGRIALQKSNRADIRQFAQRMVDDHSRVNREMAALAEQQHLRLPRKAVGEDAANIKTLSQLSGGPFDRAYVNLMVDDHRKDIADFEQEANAGQDDPIKSLAAKTLPTLREHLAMAEQLQKVTGEEKAQAPTGMRNGTPRE